MTLGASDGCPHPYRRDVAHPVGRVDRKVLLALNTSLVGGLQQSVVSGCHELFVGWVFEQVSSQLLFGKLIERKIPVKGIDHVIAVRGRRVILITMVTDGAGKTDQIKPVGGHSFAKGRLVQQGIDPVGHHLVKRSLVLGEGVRLIRMRR